MIEGVDTDYSSPGSQSSRSRAGGSGRQIHVLRPLPLIQFVGSSEALTGDVSFRVEVPDSRVRVALEIIGQPGAGSEAADNFIGGKGLTLWLRAVADSVDFGTSVPITNLWGTSAVPDPIPGYIDPTTGLAVADTNLGGWGKEFVTIGRAVVGTINYAAAFNSGAGQLVLQVRYQPDAGVRFPWDEWDEIRRSCDRSVLGQMLTGAG
jgi:hypothetical protein